MKKWHYVVSIIVLIVAAALVIYLLFINEQHAEVYTAGGTFTLAFATVFLALFTFLSVKSAYDIKETEKRDNLLKDIIDWSMEVAKVAISRQKRDTTQLWKTKLEYKLSMVKGTTYIQGISTSFTDIPLLVEATNTTIQNAINKIEVEIKKREEQKISSELYDTADIILSENEIREAVERILVKAASTNTKK